jgi:hypothetical protein
VILATDMPSGSWPLGEIVDRFISAGQPLAEQLRQVSREGSDIL